MNTEKLIALNSGKTVQVTKIDGSVEDVSVRLISITSYTQMASLMGDEAALVCAVCDRAGEWLDSITPASYEKLVEAFQATNGEYFSRWVERRIKMTQLMAPGLLEKAVQQSTLP